MKIETLTSADFDNPPKILTKSHKCDTLDHNASSAANTFRTTDIRQAVRSPNRANIFVNGKYSFSLDISQLSDTKLKINQTLSSAELSELHHLSYFGKLYTRTLEWVLTRPRSIKETRDYLRRKIYQIEHPSEQNLKSAGYRKSGDLSGAGVHFDNSPKLERVGSPARQVRSSENLTECCQNDTARTEQAPDLRLDRQFEVLRSDAEAIIERLIEKGYLDDTKFAKYLIENYHTTKGASQKRLILELRKYGISRTDITTALSETQRDDQSELRKIIAKKSPKYPDPKKLTAYLLRQGFTYEDIREALG